MDCVFLINVYSQGCCDVLNQFKHVNLRQLGEIIFKLVCCYSFEIHYTTKEGFLILSQTAANKTS